MAVWCVITVMARLMVLCTLLVFKGPLEEVAAFLAQRYSCDPEHLLGDILPAYCC
jgi:hypothetical protein